jgi:hypothetical protein
MQAGGRKSPLRFLKTNSPRSRTNFAGIFFDVGLCPLDKFGQSEIEYLHLASVAHHHVRRLEIAMDDAS